MRGSANDPMSEPSPNTTDSSRPAPEREVPLVASAMGPTGERVVSTPGAGRVRPIPVRADRPASNRPARDGSARVPPHPGKGRRSRPRPEPVRAAVLSVEPPPEPPSVRFRAQGVEWLARVAGSAASGGAPGTGAPLVLLRFARAEDPERPLREILRVGRGLADLTDGELADLLARARSVAAPPQPGELFSETRLHKKG